MIVIMIVIDEENGILANAKVIKSFTTYEQEIANKFKDLAATCDPTLKNHSGIDYDRKPRDAK